MRPASGNSREAEQKRAKCAARDCALAARDALPPAERARLSARICRRARGLPELAEARTVFMYASFRSEVDTELLLRDALARGVTVALPRIRRPRVMEALLIADPETDLAPGTWNIPEPHAALPVVAPELFDAVVLPGAAYCTTGARCGYGGGFYDTYLPQLRPGTPRIALAFEVQVLDDLPTEPHDLAVDVIVTERRMIRPA